MVIYHISQDLHIFRNNIRSLHYQLQQVLQRVVPALRLHKHFSVFQLSILAN